MPVKTYFADSLGEYLDIISDISGNRDGNQDLERPSILWFRGLSHVSHCLIPSVFRSGVRADGTGYTKLHYAEDIRTQHYIAKNYQYFTSLPSSRVEWLEVMQHHGVKTRVLDWSESSIHSLLFAIEVFFDGQKYDAEQREKCVPCVWTLSPGKLNRKIFKIIFEDAELVKDLLQELELPEEDMSSVIRKTECFYKEMDKILETEDTHHLDYILNLTTISDELYRDRCRIKNILKQGELQNPLHYFISRIYSDGVLLNKRTLPPLAVVHPYHSERIKAQKGVFSVFPFYKNSVMDDKLRKMKINPDAMENNPEAGECLNKIVICNPQKVAYQLMANGTNDSWLYPELPIVANEVENHKIY